MIIGLKVARAHQYYLKNTGVIMSIMTHGLWKSHHSPMRDLCGGTRAHRDNHIEGVTQGSSIQGGTWLIDVL